MKKITISWMALTTALLSYAPFAWTQGSLTPPGSPAATMKTLEQTEPRIPISSVPVTITQSGSYYLTGNLTAGSGHDGITVDADDVAIDLNGFTLTGAGVTSGYGILLESFHKNLTVFNGKLVGWAGNVKAAIYGVGSISWIDRVQISDCFYGIYGSNIGVKITACAVSGCQNDGIWVGRGGMIENCISFDNGQCGIVALENSIVSQCTVWSNAFFGIDGRYGHATIRECTVRDSGSSNISVLEGSLVERNLSLGSGHAGIRVYGENCRIDSNMVVSNANGIAVYRTNNLVICNSAVDNTDVNYSIIAGNKVGLIVEPVDSGAIAGDSGGGLGAIPAGRPWINFVLGATQ